MAGSISPERLLARVPRPVDGGDGALMQIAIVFGFLAQLVLLAFFAAYRWRPALAPPLGLIVYGLGAPAALFAAAGFILGLEWPAIAAFGLYAVWSAFGAWLDVIRPISWRVPPRWSVLVPYALLLTAALLAFWVPLWYVDMRLWVAFGVLYAAHTTLNAAAHRGPPAAR